MRLPQRKTMSIVDVQEAKEMSVELSRLITNALQVQRGCICFRSRPYLHLLSQYASLPLLTYLMIPPKTLQVARLYRKSLKMLSSWVIDREIFLEEATALRARFDAERGVSNAKAIRLLKVGFFFDALFLMMDWIGLISMGVVF